MQQLLRDGILCSGKFQTMVQRHWACGKLGVRFAELPLIATLYRIFSSAGAFLKAGRYRRWIRRRRFGTSAFRLSDFQTLYNY